VDRVVLNAIWGGSAAKMVVFDIVFAASAPLSRRP